jgi:hypothetical protein
MPATHPCQRGTGSIPPLPLVLLTRTTRDQVCSTSLFCSPTLDYMDIAPYILPERSMVNVEISPLLRGFIWKFRRIIAQAGILCRKLLGVMAERHTGGSGSLHARSLRAVLQSPRAAPAEYWPPRKAHSTYEVRVFGASIGSVSPPRGSPACGPRRAMVPLACREATL